MMYMYVCIDTHNTHYIYIYIIYALYFSAFLQLDDMPLEGTDSGFHSYVSFLKSNWTHSRSLVDNQLSAVLQRYLFSPTAP